MAAFADGLSPHGKFCCLKAPSKLTQVLLPACQHWHSPWFQLPACKHGCGGQLTDRGSSSLSFLEAFTDAVHRNNNFFCQRLALACTDVLRCTALLPHLLRTNKRHAPAAALPAHSQSILTHSRHQFSALPLLASSAPACTSFLSTELHVHLAPRGTLRASPRRVATRPPACG